MEDQTESPMDFSQLILFLEPEQAVDLVGTATPVMTHP
jgi:hypothetical protein